MFFFASDLHGRTHRYEMLLAAMRREAPEAVLLGGDLLPPGGAEGFIGELAGRFAALRAELGDRYPRVLMIMGNDDPRIHEAALLGHEASGVWTMLQSRRASVGGHAIYGYPYVPPTPFTLKDWERYDVGCYVDPGAVSPEEGVRTVEVEGNETRYATIEADLRRLAGEDDVTGAIFLFHTPPYGTALDRAAIDGWSVDYVPLDVHVGSIAVQRFIEARQPKVTLHGHVHESARITGRWLDRIGRTVLLGAAHDGRELSLIRFDPREPEKATRELL